MTIELTLESVITCPHCGRCSLALMPTFSCRRLYTCPHCEVQLRPKEGDCCIFCSYGSVPCPPIQREKEAANHCGGRS